MSTQQDQTLFAPMSLDATPKFGEVGDPSHALRHGGQGGTNHTVADCSNYVVRRLTPTECERLQGFPDGHTDVPYRGSEHPPDGPRYKALGNSMAVPVMRWIGERMEQVDAILGGSE